MTDDNKPAGSPGEGSSGGGSQPEDARDEPVESSGGKPSEGGSRREDVPGEGRPASSAGEPAEDETQQEAVPGAERPASSAGEPAEDETQQEDEQGRIRHQEPGSTTPREPTLAEKRARERAEQRRQEAEQAEREAAQRASDKRRKLLVGGGVTVGVVALVAAFYSASSYSQDADASSRYCSADENGRTVAEQERFCDENYVNHNGGHVDHGTGTFFMPIFLPGGQRVMQPYRYGYTGGGSPAPPVGSTVRNPSFTQPAGSAVKDRSGSTISRGGFGGFGKTSGGS